MKQYYVPCSNTSKTDLKKRRENVQMWVRKHRFNKNKTNKQTNKKTQKKKNQGYQNTAKEAEITPKYNLRIVSYTM